ncbi:putative quinol monooxygenase [Microbacterium gubbeenense]|uniref:putative quinol monooxygenase n=1 Tax=Microbacterium gubbeenense TaxID=159896 RepID=UPI003F9AAF6C
MVGHRHRPPLVAVGRQSNRRLPRRGFASRHRLSRGLSVSITVVAKFNPRPGMGSRIIDAFRAVSPQVHNESGCELYAAHLERDGDVVVMVERWSSLEKLDAHAEGAPLQQLNELTADLVTRPYEVWILDPVLLGDPARGIIPRA